MVSSEAALESTHFVGRTDPERVRRPCDGIPRPADCRLSEQSREARRNAKEMHTAAIEAAGAANGKYSGQYGQPRSPRTTPASLLIMSPRTVEYARAMAHAVIVRAGTITGARTHGSLMGSGVEAQRVGRPAAPCWSCGLESSWPPACRLLRRGEGPICCDEH